MTDLVDFHVTGQPLDGTPLHYTASGLDYIYLRNGFTIVDDPDYGGIITIQGENDLHRAIGLYVITRRKPLMGREFRFLRKLMGLKQKELAEDLGVNEQTIANYEKNKPIPSSSDKFMRVTFLLWLTPEDARAELVKRIAENIQRQMPEADEIDDNAIPSADIQSCIAREWQIQSSGQSHGGSSI